MNDKENFADEILTIPEASQNATPQSPEPTTFKGKFIKLYKNHKQPFIAVCIVLLTLIIFGITQLINYDSSLSDAQRYKNRGDRFYASQDYRRAVAFYELAIEADPNFEEVYIIIYKIHADNGDREKAWDVLLRGLANIDSEELRRLHSLADYPVI